MNSPANRAVSGQFLPGESGNPGGRPKEIAEVRDLARAYTADAISTLAEIMADKAQPPAARVSAAASILDRGWGKASQKVSGDDATPFSLVIYDAHIPKREG